jgi:hypothetical protein
VAPFRVAHLLAGRLARDLDRHGLVPPAFEVSGLGCCEIDGHDAGTWRGRPDPSAYDRAVERRRGRGAPAIASGHMMVARPPLTVRQATVLRAGLASRRFAYEGTRIARPDRYALDRAIFHRAGRGGGATILVDQSGSMSLSIDELESIVRAAGGAAVVAVYSGRGDAGELRIVARGDRRAANEHLRPYGSGNVVDLPALEWLARQPEPRLHVSDGCVTGVGDEGCVELRRTCTSLSETARITRVETASAAIEWLAERSR